MEGRPQDLRSAVSSRLSQQDDALLFARWGVDAASCPREFNPITGTYTVGVDGHYLLRAVITQTNSDAREPAFVVLVVKFASGDEHVEHIGKNSGGTLLHLRAGAVVSLRLLPPPAFFAPDNPGMRVELSIELAMRKRKRAADLEEDADEERSARAERRASRAKQRRLAEEDEGGSSRSGTGSDTEWSSGFESDDDARRAARPPPRMRRVARRLGQTNLSPAADVDSDNARRAGCQVLAPTG